jgi:hypothetical protein
LLASLVRGDTRSRLCETISEKGNPVIDCLLHLGSRWERNKTGKWPDRSPVNGRKGVINPCE